MLLGPAITLGVELDRLKPRLPTLGIHVHQEKDFVEVPHEPSINYVVPNDVVPVEAGVTILEALNKALMLDIYSMAGRRVLIAMVTNRALTAQERDRIFDLHGNSVYTYCGQSFLWGNKAYIPKREPISLSELIHLDYVVRTVRELYVEHFLNKAYTNLSEAEFLQDMRRYINQCDVWSQRQTHFMLTRRAGKSMLDVQFPCGERTQVVLDIEAGTVAFQLPEWLHHFYEYKTVNI